MDVGTALREAREQRGISLEDLARITKISPTTLRALERNQVDKIPSGIFVRGFLRAYAREVGLDGEETVKRYLAQFGQRGSAVASSAGAGPPESTRLGGHDANAHESRTPGVATGLLLGGLALAIGVAGYVALRGSRTPAAVSLNRVSKPPLAAPSPEPPPSPAPAPTQTATTGTQEATPPVTQTQNAIRLDIRTQGPCWVSVTADGATVAYRLMQPGERQTIEARNEVVLRVGDAGAFTYLINDLPGRSLDRTGQPVTIRITPQNFREFVVP